MTPSIPAPQFTPRKKDEEELFNDQSHCGYCLKEFTSSSEKVFDHSHIDGI